MRKSRFTENQILTILRNVEGGMSVDEVCAKYGLTAETYYRWRQLYGYLDPQGLATSKRLKELEEENEKLRRMYVDLSLENETLKDKIDELEG